MSQDKSEQPTHKRLQDAREKGQVVRSRDLAVAAASGAATIALGRLGGRLVQGLTDRLSADLGHVGDAPLRTVVAADLNGLVFGGAVLIGSLVGPIAAATIGVGVMVQGLQGGWTFATQPLMFDWSRLSPAKGVQRLASFQPSVDTVKTLLGVSAISYLGWQTVQAIVADSAARMPWMSPSGAAGIGWQYTESFLWRVAAVLGLLALGDYGLQRYRLMSSLKMTKQEVKDEARQSEGSPEVKGRIRRIQREMSRRRMLSDVKRATVVITNPTHYAIALEYRRGSMSAPVVLAKGRDLVAAKIREQARQHGVPMVENKPLAQALFKTTEVGESIPAGLFAAVAEVLAQLIRLKQLVL